MFFFGSLLLNIFSNHICCNVITNSANISTITPEMASLKLFLNFRILPEQFPSNYAFYNLHNF